LGVLVFEMAMGYPPFFGKNPFAVYTKILEGRVDFSSPAPLPDPAAGKGVGGGVGGAGGASAASKAAASGVPSNTKSFVHALLTQERTRRLGCGRHGFGDVKAHAFFRGVLDWNAAFHELVVPPAAPTVVHEGDSSNYGERGLW
jgi:hypothetical protein